jgi:hypothetical protein
VLGVNGKGFGVAVLARRAVVAFCLSGTALELAVWAFFAMRFLVGPCVHIASFVAIQVSLAFSAVLAA